MYKRQLARLFNGKVDGGDYLAYDISAGKLVKSGSEAAGDISLRGGVVPWSDLTAAEATAGTKLVLVEVNLPDYQIIKS